jgi:hypothetical protein
VQFGQPDQSHEVRLVDRQCAEQRPFLSRDIARLAIGLGKVHLQFRRARVRGNGPIEEGGG